MEEKQNQLFQDSEGHHAPRDFFSFFFFLSYLCCGEKKKKAKTRRNINWLTLSSLFYHLLSQAANVSEVFPACGSLFCSVPANKERVETSRTDRFLWLELHRLNSYVMFVISFDTSGPVIQSKNFKIIPSCFQKRSTVNNEPFQQPCLYEISTVQ